MGEIAETKLLRDPVVAKLLEEAGLAVSFHERCIYHSSVDKTRDNHDQAVTEEVFKYADFLSRLKTISSTKDRRSEKKAILYREFVLEISRLYQASFWLLGNKAAKVIAEYHKRRRQIEKFAHIHVVDRDKISVLDNIINQLDNSFAVVDVITETLKPSPEPPEREILKVDWLFWLRITSSTDADAEVTVEQLPIVAWSVVRNAALACMEETVYLHGRINDFTNLSFTYLSIRWGIVGIWLSFLMASASLVVSLGSLAVSYKQEYSDRSKSLKFTGSPTFQYLNSLADKWHIFSMFTEIPSEEKSKLSNVPTTPALITTATSSAQPTDLLKPTKNGTVDSNGDQTAEIQKIRREIQDLNNAVRDLKLDIGKKQAPQVNVDIISVAPVEKSGHPNLDVE